MGTNAGIQVKKTLNSWETSTSAPNSEMSVEKQVESTFSRSRSRRIWVTFPAHNTPVLQNVVQNKGTMDDTPLTCINTASHTPLWHIICVSIHNKKHRRRVAWCCGDATWKPTPDAASTP
jgi:hypothetical protein